MFLWFRYLMIISATNFFIPLSVSARITDERYYIDYKDHEQPHVQNIQQGEHSQHFQQSEHSQHVQHNENSHPQDNEHLKHVQHNDHSQHDQHNENVQHAQQNEHSHSQDNEHLKYVQQNENVQHSQNLQHVKQNEQSQKVQQNKDHVNLDVVHTVIIHNENDKHLHHSSQLISSSNQELLPNQQHEQGSHQKSYTSHSNVDLQPVHDSSKIISSSNKEFSEQHDEKENKEEFENLEGEELEKDDRDYMAEKDEDDDYMADKDEDNDYMADEVNSRNKELPSITECANAFLNTASNTFKTLGGLGRVTRDTGRQTRSIIDSIVPYAMLSSTAMQAVSFVTPVISFIANGALQLVNLAGYGISSMGTGMAFGAGFVSKTGDVIQRSSTYGASILAGVVAGGIAILVLFPYIWDLFMSLLVTFGLKTVSGIAYGAKSFMTNGSTMDTIFEMIGVFANNVLADYNSTS